MSGAAWEAEGGALPPAGGAMWCMTDCTRCEAATTHLSCADAPCRGITDPQSVEVLCQLALAAQGQQQQQRQQVPLPPPGDAMGLQLSAVQQQALAHLVGIEQRGLGGGALAQPSAPASGTAFQPWGYSAPSPQ